MPSGEENAGRPELARAEVPAEGGHTQSLLHRAIPSDGEPPREGHIRVLERLLDAGAEVDALGWGANNGLCTPLTMAAWGGHAPLVRLLIQRGADPNGSLEQAVRGHRPIDTAADHGHAGAVEELVEAGSEHSISHPLKVGLTSRLERLLNEDPDAAIRPLEDGTPPLHLAVIPAESAGQIDLLLSKGADARAADRLGRTALHVAIENDRPEAIRLLRQRGVPDDLFAAAGTGDAGRVAELLGQNPSLAKAEQADGVTPLFYAAWSGDAASAELRLDHGASVSPQARHFWACPTPLHVALQRGHGAVALSCSNGGRT